MTTQEIKRKLAAILSADVKGYSRLMEEDEVGTIHCLNAYKEVMAGLIQHHHGRVVDAPGDNVLAEFGSVVDAVECAVEIQKELETRNADLPENRKMEFRIGVNLGDVIEDGEQILGDGVNIAARLESLSEAGGIYISGTAFDHVKNKLNLGYKYLGEQTVKNILEPVRVYQVLMEAEAAGKVIGEKKSKPRQWQKTALIVLAILIVVAAAFVIWRLYLHPAPPPVEVASKEKMAFPLPDKPSIAVLPFAYTSGDPKHEYLSDGITDEVIAALSKSSQLFVIGRNSTFTYKGKPVKFQQVSEEMGVRYVLEGSVQFSGERVRITAQLIDALTGYHLFSERYDRELKDIFATQDEISMKILTATRVTLTQGEEARMFAKGTKNIEAYLKVMQAREHHEVFTKESQALARQLAEEAIALDPGYALAYSYAALALAHEVLVGVYTNPREALERGMKLVQKAVALDDSLAHPHEILGKYYIMLNKDYEKGIAEAERAVTLEPNSVDAYTQLGINLLAAGRPTEAIPILQKAMRLSPIPPHLCLLTLGICYRCTGQYEEAIAIYRRILQKEPNQLLTQVSLVATLMQAGKEDEARAEAAKVLRIDPNFSLERFAKLSLYKDRSETDRLINALRKAGLK
ncbi:MAG: tetratricopeptide repeat protein [Thermodesulfobacteriota bacterium]|jgi:adenylate cyclase